MKPRAQTDPKSLVARIVAELQASPEAQGLLLRALLTNEFLGIPARLDAIEKDVAELKAEVSVLKTDVAVLKTDVSQLKGSDLENRLHRRIRSLASQAFGLRGARVMQSPVLEPREEFAALLEGALDAGRITNDQGARIDATDFIIRARRTADGAGVWLAVEASNRVHASDIERARATAEAMHAAFDGEALAMVAGYGIDALDCERADQASVKYLKVAPAH